MLGAANDTTYLDLGRVYFRFAVIGSNTHQVESSQCSSFSCLLIGATLLYWMTNLGSKMSYCRAGYDFDVMEIKATSLFLFLQSPADITCN